MLGNGKNVKSGLKKMRQAGVVWQCEFQLCASWERGPITVDMSCKIIPVPWYPVKSEYGTTASSSSECHHMSQRANSCHCPEVTIQLKHYFYFVFTTEARTNPKGPAATLGSTVWPEVTSRRLWSHAELLSLPWVLDTAGLCSVNPHTALSTVLGASAVPRGTEGPQPHCLSEQSCGLPCFQVLVPCSCRWTGIWAFTCTCTASGNANQVDRAVHTVTAQNLGNICCTQN